MKMIHCRKTKGNVLSLSNHEVMPYNEGDMQLAENDTVQCGLQQVLLSSNEIKRMS